MLYFWWICTAGGGILLVDSYSWCICTSGGFVLLVSHELSNSQKKYKLIKEQLNEIENEKSQIYQKIEDLTDSLSKTKIISNVFDQKDVNSNRNTSNNSDRIDLEKEIENIFIKSK